MEPATATLWLAAGAGTAGIGALRFAWSLKHRSAGWNGLGWSMLALAVLLAALAAASGDSAVRSRTLTQPGDTGSRPSSWRTTSRT